MMKRKTKRIISVLTVLAMIFCSLPLTVTATGVTQESEVPDEVVSEIYPSEDESSTLDVTDRSTLSGTQLQQWSGTATDNNRAQLFKITFLGQDDNFSNLYSIRAMTNSELGITAPGSDGKIKVTTISTYDDALSTTPSTQQWAISEIATYGNYAISNGEKYLGSPPTASNGQALVCYDGYDYVKQYSYPRWIFEEYTGDDIDGTTEQNFASTLITGETYDYDICMYSSTVRRNGPVTYSVRNEDNTATDKATINATTGVLTATKPGTIEIGVTYANAPQTWWRSVQINLLIYQTRDRERLGFANADDSSDVTPITAEDLQYGQKSTYELIYNGTSISSSDLFANGEPMSVSDRVSIINLFFHNKSTDPIFDQILPDMVDHLVNGSGEDYSNPDLTDAVKNHVNTQNYVNEVVDIVKELIEAEDGNIENLYYDEELWIQPEAREQQIVVKAMLEDAYSFNLPSYGWNNGEAGLTLAIDCWYGVKIGIETFETQDGTYSGTLRFTFYDHFGLDTEDLTKERFGNLTAGHFPGFKQWYILQHWNELGADVQPKPYVTLVSYTVPFSGTY